MLSGAQRFDGAAYHAGYVVECSLKAVLLHDRSYEPTTGTTDAGKLAAWYKDLCAPKKFGHNLAAILAAAVGPEGARYLPPLHGSPVVANWTATMRYWAPGAVSEPQVAAFLNGAELAIQSVVQMRLDGVL